MILVLNCGSQSIKWKLFSKKLNLKKQGKIELKNSKKYRAFLLSELKRTKWLLGKIYIVGHRVVHGGEKFREPTKITKGVLRELEKYENLAPLHNPFNILGIKIAKRIFKKASQFAVFDTGFFKDLPQVAKIYPIPENLRKKHSILRYGFHGISHEYVAREASKIVKKPFSRLKIITCHLGGGTSITAIKNGRAIDTSMGFTPLEGLVMMTRGGNLDPGILLFLAKKIKIERLDEILNQESGIKAICGLSDMREVLEAVNRGNKKAKLALDVFVYSIQKYIGAYFGILGGCDILVFTGAIGFGSKKIRDMICRDFKILKNSRILAIQTDEELAIAKKILKSERWYKR